MKLIRMIGRLATLLSARRRKQEAKKKQLKALLRKMKAEQRELAARIKACDDALTRDNLTLRLQILTEQRRKGVALRKALKNGER
ncbi:hypothetical protein [Pseudothauera lacus]|uniref:Uncharacterized protein n=1 Tax=Pseudothauera lacus TaxID=2136175 RepID=A0A2T4IHM8_9RHOO|nr:hypothetical protein [Pseudothauera lacus]PTD97279.1 hypothetical protein C8261_04505 [Pseudothauera lacus]